MVSRIQCPRCEKSHNFLQRRRRQPVLASASTSSSRLLTLRSSGHAQCRRPRTWQTRFDSCRARSNALLCSIGRLIRQKLFWACQLRRPSPANPCVRHLSPASTSSPRSLLPPVEMTSVLQTSYLPIEHSAEHRPHRRPAGAESLQYQKFPYPVRPEHHFPPPSNADLTHQCRRNGNAPADMGPAASTLALTRGQ